MKNIVEYIIENSINEAVKQQFLYVVKDVDLNSDLTKKEVDDFNKTGVYVARHNDLTCDFYCIGKYGADKLLRFFMKYEGTDNENDVEDVYPGILDATEGKGEPLYCFVSDIDVDTELPKSEVKKFNDAGIEVSCSNGTYSDFTLAFFVRTKEAFEKTLLPWMKTYCDGDETDVMAMFPMLAPYIKK